MSSANLPPSLNLSPSVKSTTTKPTKGKKKTASVGQFPNIVRADGTPNVGPPALNTMEMSISKQKAALQKRKCADAHLNLVCLLVPPKTQLAAQAARLMTSEDPPGSNDIKYCPYCLKHKNKRLTHKESNCYAKHLEKRPKDDDNTKKDVPKGPQKPNPKSKTSLRKANQLLKKTLADHNIKIGADGTTS